MKFDVYGRFDLEVVREEGSWVAFRLGLGKRIKETSIGFPTDIEEEEIATFLDDLFHELSRPGERVRRKR